MGEKKKTSSKKGKGKKNQGQKNSVSGMFDMSQMNNTDADRWAKMCLSAPVFGVRSLNI